MVHNLLNKCTHRYCLQIKEILVHRIGSELIAKKMPPSIVLYEVVVLTNYIVSKYKNHVCFTYLGLGILSYS